MIDFVSGPVLSGFTSAAALMIGSSQIKDLLGIKATGTTFVEMWTHIVYNIGETSLWDAVLGGVSIALLLILKVNRSKRYQANLRNCCRLLQI